jgi:hypothetical protein
MAMNGDQLFEQLNSSKSFDINRPYLRVFLLEQLAEHEREPARGEEIAYGIAGLLGAQAIMRLPESDPYLKILYLAGDLELPPHQRDTDSTWDRYRRLVRALPEAE